VQESGILEVVEHGNDAVVTFVLCKSQDNLDRTFWDQWGRMEQQDQRVYLDPVDRPDHLDHSDNRDFLALLATPVRVFNRSIKIYFLRNNNKNCMQTLKRLPEKQYAH